MIRCLLILCLLASSALADHDYDVHDGAQPIAAIPWADAAECALSPFGECAPNCKDGYEAKQPLERTSEKYVKNYRGKGLRVANDGRVADSVSIHNYVGAYLGASDSRITDCDLINNRCTGLWIARDAGNCQSQLCHCYGARIAIYCAPCWAYRSNMDTIADGPIGFLGDGWNATLTDDLFQHLTNRAFVLRGPGQQLINCRVYVQREVTEFPKAAIPGFPEYAGTVGGEMGDDSAFIGGHLEMSDWKHPLHNYSGKPAEALRVNGNNVHVVTRLIDVDGIGGTRGIHVTKPVTGLKLRVTATGFDLPDERVLVFDDPRCTIDVMITLRPKKPLTEYVDIGSGWKGSLKLVNADSGVTKTVPVGSAF